MPRKKIRRNITRVETTHANGKVYCGWEVRLQRQGRKFSQFFSDLAFDGKMAALKAAKEYRDDLEQRFKKSNVAQMSRNPSERNRSGLVGVRLRQQKDRKGEYEYQYWHWVAQWIDGHGKRKTKSFSVHQYGEEEALRLAIQSRREGVESANR
jgi:hypothetical protein